MSLYIFNADEYHGICVIRELGLANEYAESGYVGVDSFLHEVGHSLHGLCTDDEHTYDSDQWPKEHDGDLWQEDGEGGRTRRHCGRCLNPLEDDPPATCVGA